MNDHIVTTPKGGEVRLKLAPENIVQRVRDLLPMGLEVLPSTAETRYYGIVMQRGSQEAIALKQQAVDMQATKASISSKVHTLLITMSLVPFSEKKFPGLLMPCSYARKTASGMIEPGIGYFGGMPPVVEPDSKAPLTDSFDDVMGHGFTDLFANFAWILQDTSKLSRLTLPSHRCLDLQPRSQLELIEFGFLVVDGAIVAIKTAVTPNDPAWVILHRCGLRDVWHLPSIPIAVPEREKLIKPKHLAEAIQYRTLDRNLWR